jgi:hypothetical protein
MDSSCRSATLGVQVEGGLSFLRDEGVKLRETAPDRA